MVLKKKNKNTEITKEKLQWTLVTTGNASVCCNSLILGHSRWELGIQME